jgi:uroporphyrinogen-III synthase
VADVVPASASASALVEALGTPGGSSGAAPGRSPTAGSSDVAISSRDEMHHSMLLPRALEGRDELPDGLRAAGWHVDAVAAYQTVGVPVGAEEMEVLREADAVVFASPSAVAAARGLEIHGRIVCVGPTTAAAARSAGRAVHAVAASPTAPGVVDAVVTSLL